MQHSKMTELNSACSAYTHGYILSTSHLVAYVLDKILNKFFPLNVYLKKKKQLLGLCAYVSEILISRRTAIRYYYITILYPRVL